MTSPSIVSSSSASWSSPRRSVAIRSVWALETLRRRRSWRSSVPSTRASPQSITYTSPKRPTMTLAGLRSRWMTPLACAKAIASQAFNISPRTRVTVQPSSRRRTRARTCLRSSPFTSCMVKNTLPSASIPSSWTETIPGWSSWPVTWASSRKRPSMRGSSWSWGVELPSLSRPTTTFIARCRRRSSSQTRRIEPIPPRPTSRSILYRLSAGTRFWSRSRISSDASAARAVVRESRSGPAPRSGRFSSPGTMRS